VEYLVTMTTRVPNGTPEQAVDDIRAREATRSGELAAHGSLLRLWRPPLQPGEWRTLGLFAADNSEQLEDVLASMPLRVWRTDEVTPLWPHPNDPGTRPQDDVDAGAQEFLIAFVVTVPEGTAAGNVADMKEREAQRAHELADQGHIERLWRLEEGTATWRSLGVWRAHDPTELQTLLDSLPMHGWIEAGITPLTPHPSDPALGGVSRGAGI
jgi:muconolactone delta-isomerase